MNTIDFLVFWDILLAIIGPNSGGKDTAGEYFASRHGCAFVSTGDHIRDLITKRKLGDHSRETMNKVSTLTRRSLGPAWPVPGILQANLHVPRLVLGGPRLPAELEPIRAAGGKILVVDCPIEIRYERAKLRRRIGDDVSLDKFIEIEQLESASDDQCAHNVKAAMAMADDTIMNDCSLLEFHMKLDAYMAKLLSSNGHYKQ